MSSAVLIIFLLGHLGVSGNKQTCLCSPDLEVSEITLNIVCISFLLLKEEAPCPTWSLLAYLVL